MSVINTSVDASSIITTGDKYIYASYFTIDNKTYLSAECAEVAIHTQSMIFTGTSLRRVMCKCSGDNVEMEETERAETAYLWLYPDGSAKLLWGNVYFGGNTGYYYIDFENQIVRAEDEDMDIFAGHKLSYTFSDGGRILEIIESCDKEEMEGDIMAKEWFRQKLNLDMIQMKIKIEGESSQTISYPTFPALGTVNYSETFSAMLYLSETKIF